MSVTDLSQFSIDLGATTDFVTTHARLLERHRFALLLGDADAAHHVLVALDAYRNADGGYGWGLEPDLRDGTSQPVGAMHAFEVLEEVARAGEAADAVRSRAVALCDWLASVSRPDGGLPFAFPVRDATGCAPWWATADPATSSLHISCAVAAAAHRLAAHDLQQLRTHAGLRALTAHCVAEIESRERADSAYELLFVLQLLDALCDVSPDASGHLQRLSAAIPASGVVPVEGGVEGEALRVLDFAPRPDRPIRARFDTGAVRADLARLASLPRDDGGWPVEWATVSPASAIEWRGMLTVRAVTVLHWNSGSAGP